MAVWIPRRGSDSLSVELGFRIPIVSGIPDSLSCFPDSKAQDSGFRRFPEFGNSGIRIPLAGAIDCFQSTVRIFRLDKFIHHIYTQKLISI